MASITDKQYDSVPAKKVAFIGLGVMGFPMAGHLARAGHDVTVYNRTASKSDNWVSEFGGRSAATPAAAAKGADIVFCCVGNDNDLRSVTTAADGAFHGMEPGAVFVDHTTASADVARELAAAERAGRLLRLDG
ncbi:MAG: NAD(P)-binding domain-containing protein, partial [Advenella sp.]